MYHYSMRKFFVALAFLSAFTFIPLFAQASVDTSHRFYRYAQSWELRGLISEVPPLRPYPLANIKAILETVMENGNEEDVEIAKELWEEETGRAWHATVGVEASYKLTSNDESLSKDDFLVALTPGVFGEFSLFNDFVSMGYDFALDGFALGDKHGFNPLYTKRPYDYAEDAAKLGPFKTYIDINDLISVGKTNIFFQGGLSRRGYGPFLSDGTMIDDSSIHAPNFQLTYINPRFSYTQMISIIAASTCTGPSVCTFDKYFAFHAVELNFFNGKFSVAYVENTIFGERFDPSYLLPVPFMAIQTLYDAADNLQMGLVFKFKPIKGLQFSAEVYVDDMDVNNIVKFNFDTRNRFNFRVGGVYAPENSICSLVQFDYMAIMPFMYTHWQYESATSGLIPVGQINYSDYTHYGNNIATALPPNSERVYFKIDLTPFKNFNLSISSAFIRHGNVAESFTEEEAITFLLAASGQYSTDGSIFTHSMFENENGTSLNVIPTGHYHLNYLTQTHQMYVIQAGIDADYTFFRAKYGSLAVTFSYNFECIINKGVDSHLYPGGLVTDNNDGTYDVEGWGTSKTQAEVVQYFKDSWADSMRNVFNNYFTIGIRYTF